VTLLQLI